MKDSSSSSSNSNSLGSLSNLSSPSKRQGSKERQRVPQEVLSRQINLHLSRNNRLLHLAVMLKNSSHLPPLRLRHSRPSNKLKIVIVRGNNNKISRSNKSRAMTSNDQLQLVASSALARPLLPLRPSKRSSRRLKCPVSWTLMERKCPSLSPLSSASRSANKHEATCSSSMEVRTAHRSSRAPMALTAARCTLSRPS